MTEKTKSFAGMLQAGRTALVAATLILASCLAYAQENQDAVIEDGDAESVQPLPPPTVSELGDMMPARPNIENRAALGAYISGVVDAYMRDKHFAGATVAIVKDGETLYAQGHGIASEDGAPVEADNTMFRLGSISKTFTWIAMMQLWEQGKVDLDGEVNSYLPADLQIPDEGFERPILIRHLMTHSAGFEDTAAGHLFVRDEDKITPLADYVRTYRPARVREPGESISYSNYSSAVAGVIIERLAGEDFQSYVEENITGPLGMYDTTFREPYAPRTDMPEPMSADLAEKMSQGLVWRGGRMQEGPFPWIAQIANVGAVWSTAEDMTRYMQMWLNEGAWEGNRILRAATVRKMRETLHEVIPGVNGFSHGLFQYSTPDGSEAFGHGGSTSHFMSSMYILPTHNMGIFISTNSGSARPLRGEFARLIMERYLDEPEPAPAPPSDFTSRGQKYAGIYRSDRHSWEGLEKLGMLDYGTTHVSVDEDGYLITREQHGSGTAWVEIGPNLFREVGGYRHMGFGVDADGEVIKLYPDSPHVANSRISYFETANWFWIIMGLAAFAAAGSVTGAWLRRKRPVHESLNETVSSRLCGFMGMLWVAFFISFAYAMINMGANAFYEFPTTTMVTSLVFALLGTGLLVLNLPGVLIIWKDRSWPFWRRVRHTSVILIDIALVMTLYSWNMIGFHYF